MPHRDTVIYTNRIKFKRDASIGANFLLDHFSYLVEEKVSRNDFDERVGNTDKWFVEILIFQACCSE